MITHLVELSGPEAIRRTGLAQKQLGIAWNWFLATNICHDVFMSKSRITRSITNKIQQIKVNQPTDKSIDYLTNREIDQ